jgi:hypothetical protein
MIGAALLVLLVSAPWTGVPGIRCHTYEEQSLSRWQTICSDGTRGVSTYNTTLERWDTVIIPAGTRRRGGTPASVKNQQGWAALVPHHYDL